jgi:N-acetylglucosamine kinase-like BadF-type ATPase
MAMGRREEELGSAEATGRIRLAGVIAVREGRGRVSMERGGMKLAVGVDVGNTKTIAVACDLEGELRGVGRGTCGNWEELGEKGSADVITEVVGQALNVAGAERQNVAHAHMGMAGLDWPDDEPRMREALAAAGWECGLTLENDSFLTLRAGAPEGDGIGVTAGTGICCAIVRPDGEKYFYGGFTDLGGGTSTAGRAVQAVIRAEDGRGQPTALTEAVLAATGHSSTWELVYDMHRRGRHISGDVVNPVLFSAADKGDAAAVEIVTRFGCEMALCATNLIGRYGLAEEDVAVVAAGSRFVKTGPLLFEVFRREVLKAAPRARVVLSDYPPVMGAVRGALAACGRAALEVWEEAKRSAAATGWFAEDAGGAREGGGDDE